MDNERITLNWLSHGDGIAPVFSASEMAVLKHRAEAALKIIMHPAPLSLGKKLKQPYDCRAYHFVMDYKRNELPWAQMNRNQREWLLKIKDSLQ